MTLILPANGIIRRLYIDPYEFKEDGQPIRILEGEIKNPLRAAEVLINGPSELCFDPDKYPWIDSHVWVQTHAELTLLDKHRQRT